MPKIFPGLSKIITKSALRILRIKRSNTKTFKPFHYALLSVSRKFFAKILLMFLVFFSLPVILISVPIYYVTQSNMKEEVNKNNENMLVKIKDNLEMMIDDTDSLNLIYSTNPEMISMLKQILNNDMQDSNYIRNSSILESFLVSLAASRPYIFSIYIYSENRSRMFLSSTDGLVTLDRYFDRSWFQSYLERYDEPRSFWMEARRIKRYSFEKPIDVITIYKEFFSENGIIALNLSKDYLVKQIDELNLLKDQAFFVLNEQNEIMLKSRNGANLPDGFLSQISSGKKQYLNIAGTAYYINQMDSDKYKWKYISATPLSTLYESAIQLRNVLILIFFLSIVVCVGFAFIITQRTCSYVSTIIAVLDRAEKGLPVPPLPPSFLRNEFNEMIQSILKSYLEQSSLKIQLKENQYRMEILQITALQSQMNPHFLFNTLKAIFWMSFKLTNARNEVSQMVECLSNILHYSMDNQTRYVRFREEIEAAQDYIAIEKTRYKEKIDVIWEYPEHIGDYYTLKLLIQPFLENAIHHGLRQHTEKGCIKIKLVEQADVLLLYVTDNGIGMERERVSKLNRELARRQEPNGHIGIYNCNRRIFLAFGERYGVSIKSKQGCGTSVCIRLPKLKMRPDR